MRKTKITKKVISAVVALGMASALWNIPGYAAAKLRTEAENSALNDFAADETVDDSYEGLRGGNLKYTFNISEPGQYRLDYKYCSVVAAEVFLYEGTDTEIGKFTATEIDISSNPSTEICSVYTTTVDIAVAGEYTVNVYTDDGESLYGDYMELSEIEELKINVEKSGTYPVKVIYTAPSGTVGSDSVTLVTGGNTYKINNPALDGAEHSYTIDMELTAGENLFTAASETVIVTSVEIDTSLTRRYEGEEINPENLKTFTNVDGTLEITGGGLNSRSHTIVYNASVAGNYKIDVRFCTVWGKTMYAYVNGSETGTSVGRSGYNSSIENIVAAGNDPMKTLDVTPSFTAALKKGENTIEFVCENIGYIDYVDITAPAIVGITVAESGTYPVKVTYTAPTGTVGSDSITLSDGINTYKINNPALDGKDHSYTIDMVLAKGENSFTITTSTATVKSLEIDNSLKRRYEGEELNNIRVRTEADGAVTSAFEADSQWGIGQYHTIKYNAPAAGNYRIDIRVATGNWRPVDIYANAEDGSIPHSPSEDEVKALGGVRVPATAGDTVFGVRTAALNLNKGENTIIIACWNYGYLDYADITAPATASITVAEAGTYPVKVTYTAPTGTVGSDSITLSDATNIYKINNPALDGADHSYTIDMALKAGENTFAVTTSTAAVKSLTVDTSLTRRYEGEEINPTQLYYNENTEIIAGKGIANADLGLSQYHIIKYNAPCGGAYTVSVRLATAWQRTMSAFANIPEGSQLVHAPTDEQVSALGGVRVGNTTDENTFGIRTFKLNLQKGENTIYLECWNYANVDYIDITAPKYVVVNNDTAYIASRIVTSVSAENSVTLSSGELLSDAMVVAGLFKGNKLERVISVKESVTTIKAFEEIDLGSVSVSGDDLTGYEIHIFVWNDMKPVF